MLGRHKESWFSLPARVTARGITLTRHLINLYSGSWIDAEDLHRPFYGMRVSSLRLINQDLQQLQQLLIKNFPALFYEHGFQLNINLLKNLPERPDTPLDIKISSSTNGLTTTSKIIYSIFNNVVNSHPPVTSTYWHTSGLLIFPNPFNGRKSTHYQLQRKKGTSNSNLFITCPSIQHALTLLHSLIDLSTDKNILTKVTEA